jgi:hypothetical protein
MPEPSEHFGAGRNDPVPEFEPIARRYLLLPHERWAARRYFDHWYSPEHCNSATTRENGPVAMVLRGAFRAWMIPGWAIGLIGLGTMIASGGGSYSSWMIGIGMTLIVVGVARLLPAIPATRRYQAERAAESAGGGAVPRPPPPPAGPSGGADGF